MLNLTVGYLCAKCVLAMLFTFAENISYEKSEPRCSVSYASCVTSPTGIIPYGDQRSLIDCGGHHIVIGIEAQSPVKG
jgi:hypothetical protein